MICRNCQKEISDQATVCPECGTPVTPQFNQTYQPNQDSQPNQTYQPHQASQPNQTYQPNQTSQPFQTYAPVPEYYEKLHGNPVHNGKAVGSLVLGIISMIAWFLPRVGYPWSFA